MEHHTFVCGTAKSKEEDAYYIYHSDRFWGTLYDAGVTNEKIAPADYRRLGQEYGIYLTEIVDPAKYRVASDSEITRDQVTSGLEALKDRIETHDPNRIAFAGKNAATWFYRYCENKQITHSQTSSHRNDRRNLTGFELDWDYLGLDYYLLSNTHRHWDRDVWLQFWIRCRGDVEVYRR